MDDTISESISGLVFLVPLKDAGATPDEAKDYIEQYALHQRNQGSAGSGLPSGQPNTNVTNLVDTATSIAWALLHAKVNHFQGASSQLATTSDGSLSKNLTNLLGLSSAKGAIPASILAKVPHLSMLSVSTATDPHLKKTQDLLSVYSPQNSQDILVNKALFAPVANPLPRTIWHKVLLNLFVNFEQPFCFNG